MFVQLLDTPFQKCLLIPPTQTNLCDYKQMHSNSKGKINKVRNIVPAHKIFPLRQYNELRFILNKQTNQRILNPTILT